MRVSKFECHDGLRFQSMKLFLTGDAIRRHRYWSRMAQIINYLLPDVLQAITCTGFMTDGSKAWPEPMLTSNRLPASRYNFRENAHDKIAETSCKICISLKIGHGCQGTMRYVSVYSTSYKACARYQNGQSVSYILLSGIPFTNTDFL